MHTLLIPSLMIMAGLVLLAGDFVTLIATPETEKTLGAIFTGKSKRAK